MSAVAIKAALETALQAMTPPLPIAWPNVKFTPQARQPYQRCNLMLAEPDNDEMGAAHTERGYLQVTLCFPLNAGEGAALTRAELIRTIFPRGRALTAAGVTTTVFATPEIMPGYPDADRYCVPVKIRFRAFIPVP